LGQQLPALLPTALLSRPQKKARLRCLLEKGVVQRLGRDQVQLRIVWRGGDVTESVSPIPVGALAELSTGQELEARVLQVHQAGKSDDVIAQELTAAGFRSPMHPHVLVSTVRGLRLKHRCFITQHQSHPRSLSGFLPCSVAHRLGLLGAGSPLAFSGGRRPRKIPPPASACSIIPRQLSCCFTSVLVTASTWVLDRSIKMPNRSTSPGQYPLPSHTLRRYGWLGLA
jgi:hypothetical protein